MPLHQIPPRAKQPRPMGRPRTAMLPLLEHRPDREPRKRDQACAQRREARHGGLPDPVREHGSLRPHQVPSQQTGTGQPYSEHGTPQAAAFPVLIPSTEPPWIRSTPTSTLPPSRSRRKPTCASRSTNCRLNTTLSTQPPSPSSRPRAPSTHPPAKKSPTPLSIYKGPANFCIKKEKRKWYDSLRPVPGYQGWADGRQHEQLLV